MINFYVLNAQLLDEVLIQLLDQLLYSVCSAARLIFSHSMFRFRVNFYMLNAQLLDQLLIQIAKLITKCCCSGVTWPPY